MFSDQKNSAQVSSPRAPRRRILLAGFTLAAFFSLYYYFYLEGISYEQEAGIRGWLAAINIPWGRYVGYLLSPISERLTATQSNYVTIRVTEFFFLKALYLAFKDSMTAVAIFNGLVGITLGIAMFLFGYRCTKSVLAAFLYPLFLLTTPAYGWTVMEYGDSGPSDQIFLLCYCGFFLWHLKKIIEEPAKPLDLGRIFSLVALWFVGMLAIKAKEPEKFLVPAISWVMVLFNPSSNLFKSDARQRVQGFLPLCIVLALLSLPLVLVKEGAPEHVFGWQDPFYWLFWNPFAWEPEKTCCLFTLHRGLPGSILSNFGFFLSWAAIFSTLAICRHWWKSGRKVLSPAGISITLLLLSWTLMGLSFHTKARCLFWIRLMTWDLPPFGLLVAFGFTRFLGISKGRTKTVLATLLVALTLCKIADNIRHSVYFRQELASIWVPKAIFRAEVYKDATGAKDDSLFNVYNYWWPRNDFTRELEPYMYHKERHDLLQDGKFENFLRRYKTVYVGSNHPLELPWKTVLLKEIDASKLSRLATLKSRFSSEPPKRYYLYRVSLP